VNIQLVACIQYSDLLANGARRAWLSRSVLAHFKIKKRASNRGKPQTN
jgi:hypothetical protein